MVVFERERERGREYCSKIVINMLVAHHVCLKSEKEKTRRTVGCTEPRAFCTYARIPQPD